MQTEQAMRHPCTTIRLAINQKVDKANSWPSLGAEDCSCMADGRVAGAVWPLGHIKLTYALQPSSPTSGYVSREAVMQVTGDSQEDVPGGDVCASLGDRQVNWGCPPWSAVQTMATRIDPKLCA